MNKSLEKFHIIGESQAMRELAEWTYTAAPTWDTILMTG